LREEKKSGAGRSPVPLSVVQTDMSPAEKWEKKKTTQLNPAVQCRGLDKTVVVTEGRSELTVRREDS